WVVHPFNSCRVAQPRLRGATHRRDGGLRLASSADPPFYERSSLMGLDGRKSLVHKANQGVRTFIPIYKRLIPRSQRRAVLALSAPGSTRTYSLSVFTFSIVVTAPLGQRTTRASITSEGPRPTVTRGSLDDSMLQPPLRWRWIVRPAAVTSTLAPTASRLLR